MYGTWGNASTWDQSFGKTDDLSQAEMAALYQKGQTSRAKAAGASDLASGLSQLTNIGVQVGEVDQHQQLPKAASQRKKG